MWNNTLATNLTLLEAALVFALLLLAPYCVSPAVERRLNGIGATFSRLASHRVWSIVVVGLLAFGAKAALAPVIGIRAPAVHDEYSYLLAAETFASGRFTNPTHPMWVHFESFHIDFQPTYMSMYPPLQGGFLALGKVLFGHPIAGVWVSIAAFCAALCWMLQGWVTPGWALLGSLLAIVRLALFGTWGNTYFGGAPAALGGALVLGALPRLKASPTPANSMLLAAGLLLLANSRPYEGVALAVSVAAALLLWAAGKGRPPFPVLLRRAILPGAALLLLGAAFMAYYDWRVFGDPWTLPYENNRKAYAVVGVFLWDKPGPIPEYHHSAFRDFFVDFELRHFTWATSWSGFLETNGWKLLQGWAFFLGPALTLPLAAAATLIRRREMQFPIVAGALFGVAMVANTWFMPHYAAPATALLYLVLIYGMRQMKHWRIEGRPVGMALVAGVPLICLAMAAVRAGEGELPAGYDEPTSWCCSGNGNQDRVAMLRRLSALPGKQVVLVRYEGDSRTREWVYNEPDIDASNVVWARFMDPERNRDLLDYYPDRRPWLLEASDGPPRLSPYDPAAP